MEKFAANNYLSQPPRDIEFSNFDAQAYVWSYSGLKNFNALESLPVDLREYINSASPASGMTPLGLAALCHDLPAVKDLLRLEANIDASQGEIETPWGINAINLANMGLKAHSITAWGNAPGIETRKYLRAESPLYCSFRVTAP